MPEMSEHDQREYGQLYTVAKRILTPLFRFGWRVKVSGLENVPSHGPAILCPNHTSVIDSFMMPLVLPRRITFVGKAEYMDDWKTKFIFPAMGMIPIDRGGGKAAVRALNTAARVLERGELFGIYPEGTRSRDGKLHKGHTGAARLSLRTRAPIIPVGMRGTRDIQPPDAKFPKPFKVCSISFGTPVDPGRYSDHEDRLVLRQMTDEVMFSIREMSGQEYIDVYATKKAEGLPTEVVHIAAPPEPRRSSADVLNQTGAIAAAQ